MSNKKKDAAGGIGGEIELRLDELLGTLGSVFQEAIDRLDSDGAAEVLKERSFPGANGPIRASAGIRIRAAGQTLESRDRSDDPPARRADKPINPQRKAPPTKAPPEEHLRDISATIFDEPDHWSLVAELPGIAPEDVALSQDADELVIEAAARGRRYLGRFKLPGEITFSQIERSVQNGIVELFAPKTAK